MIEDILEKENCQTCKFQTEEIEGEHCKNCTHNFGGLYATNNYVREITYEDARDGKTR